MDDAEIDAWNALMELNQIKQLRVRQHGRERRLKEEIMQLRQKSRTWRPSTLREVA